MIESILAQLTVQSSSPAVMRWYSNHIYCGETNAFYLV
jgi:hypothetical protein